jgi:hypothetical protein
LCLIILMLHKCRLDFFSPEIMPLFFVAFDFS